VWYSFSKTIDNTLYLKFSYTLRMINIKFGVQRRALVFFNSVHIANQNNIVSILCNPNILYLTAFFESLRLWSNYIKCSYFLKIMNAIFKLRNWCLFVANKTLLCFKTNFKKFKGIVSRDFVVCFLVSFDRSDISTHQEQVLLLFKVRFRIEFLIFMSGRNEPRKENGA
jgi:hypothetical protein